MSALYPSFEALMLTAGIDLENDVGVKLWLVNTASYTYSPGHRWLSDVTVGARVGVPVALAGRTVNVPWDGVFDAADTIVPAVTGPPVGAYVLFKDTGVEATSPLIAYIDGFYVEPNGGAILIQHSNGPFRIFGF